MNLVIRLKPLLYLAVVLITIGCAQTHSESPVDESPPRSLVDFQPSPDQEVSIGVPGSNHIEIHLAIELTGLSLPEGDDREKLDYLREHVFMEVDGARLSNEDMYIELVGESDYAYYFIFWEYEATIGSHEATLVIVLNEERTTEFRWTYQLIP